MTNIDPRYYQILFLSLFLLLGISTRDWSLNPVFIMLTIGSCLLTQIIADFISKKIRENERSLFYNLPSALITSLGLSLLLRCNDYHTMILAGILAILSKFLLQFQHKHFFNPANFGIISVLLLTSDAWVSPGQWGDDWWYGLLFLGTGGIILKKVGRWDTTVIFLLSYSLLEAIRNLWLGWTFDVFIHRLSSGSLLLFALFMITDPRSIPDAQLSRIIWAIAIAITTFILRNYFYINTAVFYALFIISPLTVILDLIWQYQRFKWQKETQQTLVKT
jgi:Na+-transporting NADH:ubiquinone oxidoreductase subunit NqrB